MLSTNSSILKNSIFILAAKGVQVVSSFFILIMVARYLSVLAYGEYTFIIAFVTSLMALSYFGIQQVLIRDIARDRENAGHYLGVALRLRSYLTATAVVALFLSIKFMDLSAEATVPFIIAIASETFLAFSMLGRAVFQAYEKMFYEPAIALAYYLSLTGFILAAIGLDLGLTGIIAASAASNLIQFALTSIILFRGFVRPELNIKGEVLRKFFVDSAIVGIGVFLCQNLSRINVLLLKWLGSLESVAFFQAPHNTVLQVQILPAALIAAMFPVIARLEHNEPEKAFDFYEKIFRYFFVLNFLIAMYFSLFAEEVIRVAFGDKYLGAVPALRVVSWAIIPLSMDMVSNVVLVAMNRQRYIVFYAGLMLAVNILAGLFFIPKYGYMAASYIALVSYTGLFLCSLYFLSNTGFKASFDKILTRTCLAGILSGAVVLLIKGPGLGSLALAASLGAITYFGVLYMAGIFRKNELSAFASLIWKKQW